MASFEVDVKDGGSHSYWSNYDNPSAIALVHKAEAEFDDAKRAALYGQIQAIVAQDAPFVPLDYPPYIYACAPQVHGFAVNPGGAYRLEDVWLGSRPDGAARPRAPRRRTRRAGSLYGAAACRRGPGHLGVAVGDVPTAAARSR